MLESTNQTLEKLSYPNGQVESSLQAVQKDFLLIRPNYIIKICTKFTQNDYFPCVAIVLSEF